MDDQLLELFKNHKELQDLISEKEGEIKTLKDHQFQIRTGINNALEKGNYGLITFSYFKTWRERKI